MYVVVRSYAGQGAQELFDLLAQREDDARQVVTTIPGFVSFSAFRSANGGATVTVCEDEEGIAESVRRAADWVTENVGATVDAPVISEGPAVLHF